MLVSIPAGCIACSCRGKAAKPDGQGPQDEIRNRSTVFNGYIALAYPSQRPSHNPVRGKGRGKGTSDAHPNCVTKPRNIQRVIHQILLTAIIPTVSFRHLRKFDASRSRVLSRIQSNLRLVRIIYVVKFMARLLAFARL